MILLIDNYDSFTYNVYQDVARFSDVLVVRNDELTVNEIRDLNPTGIIISPGPGGPHDAGVSLDVVRQLSGQIPILGVCLGHQVIAEAFGGTVGRAKQVMHGKTSVIETTTGALFDGEPMDVMRYHSLVVQATELNVTATTADGVIMALEHPTHPTYGVQFHPESIGTPDGRDLFERFVAICHTKRPRNVSPV
ncbi:MULTISPECIES: aminodeoxychorismate/anthranilate synthase component II [unclassified Exiguobacterium]|uniref:anthranilate synthase component II n=1 Tax=unclassified Exiguobacterium TaxID=2644629 RepID=UPI0010403222|nr:MULTISPECIES: aminodeoxychorismate/anthranilate synthase component II [unclassified Exiguobacterium]TCI48172.1 aminodeoxychorismate/anthranilate synthase component II [Exiguobacterium sp. SH5S32]TCI55059.1 aminodeoxychorismate/anthranilate synthase component II [Exiguobacterium sp. SH1S4]TCI74851.1 aminodeoxychorismate/anthranilate synthase component II [Exiguobacterium sp. SH1S1]